MSEDDSSLGDALDRALEAVQANFQELGGESDRAAAILAMASLEDALELLIRSKFPRDISNTNWKKIAGPGFTPMGTLNAKNDIALAFGFYGPKTRALIETLSAVRNKFAHSTDVRSFSHADIVRHCEKLNGNAINPEAKVENGMKPLDIRWAYIDTVKALEKRLTIITQYLPELGDEPPEPLP